MKNSTYRLSLFQYVKFYYAIQHFCIGCGWYDFETWRNALNQKLSQVDQNEVN